MKTVRRPDLLTKAGWARHATIYWRSFCLFLVKQVAESNGMTEVGVVPTGRFFFISQIFHSATCKLCLIIMRVLHGSFGSVQCMILLGRLWVVLFCHICVRFVLHVVFPFPEDAHYTVSFVTLICKGYSSGHSQIIMHNTCRPAVLEIMVCATC